MRACVGGQPAAGRLLAVAGRAGPVASQGERGACRPSVEAAPGTGGGVRVAGRCCGWRACGGIGRVAATVGPEARAGGPAKLGRAMAAEGIAEVTDVADEDALLDVDAVCDGFCEVAAEEPTATGT